MMRTQTVGTLFTVCVLALSHSVATGEAVPSVSKTINYRCPRGAAITGIIGKPQAQSTAKGLDIVCHAPEDAPASKPEQIANKTCDTFAFIDSLSYQIIRGAAYQDDSLTLRLINLHCSNGPTIAAAEPASDSTSLLRSVKCGEGEYLSGLVWELGDETEGVYRPSSLKPECTDVDFEVRRQSTMTTHMMFMEEDYFGNLYSDMASAPAEATVQELDKTAAGNMDSFDYFTGIYADEITGTGFICSANCSECDLITLQCLLCDKGHYPNQDGQTCGPCGVEHCAVCESSLHPAQECDVCLPGYVLALPDSLGRERCVWGESLGNDPPVWDGVGPHSVLCESELWDACVDCEANNPSVCSTCRPGYTKYGKHCVMFNETGAWQRWFYGFDGRRIDVVNFDAGSWYNLLTHQDMQVNVRFDGIINLHSAVALNRQVNIATAGLHVEAALILDTDGATHMEVVVDGDHILTQQSANGDIRTAYYPATLASGEPTSVTVKTLKLSNSEMVSVETSFLAVAVTRKEDDLQLHFTMKRNTPGAVHGMVGRSAALARFPRGSFSPVSYVYAPSYQVTKPYGTDFSHNLYKDSVTML